MDTLAAVEASDTPLASIWVYDHKSKSLGPKNITFENERSFMLKAIAAANRKFLDDLNKEERSFLLE
jgi:hypothetical protein